MIESREHRQRQIVEVFARFGLDYFVSVVGLERLVARGGVVGGRKRRERRAPPEDLRLALEELGPTFIKLGQLLSTRADLLPSEYRAALAKLQDAAPAVPADVVGEIIEGELHVGASDAVVGFHAEPLAAASIGQAHLATLRDGTEVVVKVRRPDVVEQVGEDLEILRNLAARASRRSEAAARYDLVGLADEFVETLRAELDYLAEGRNADRFATNFAGDS